MWQRRFVAGILRHRMAVFLVVGFVSIVAAVFASRVEMESSIEIWFLEDDPTLVSYHQFLDRFGADEFTVIGIFAPDVFEPKILDAVDRLTKAAETAPYAHRVLSLTTVKVFESVDGGVEIAPLVRELPRTAEESRALRRRALDSSWVAGNLVSEDGRVAAVIVEMDPAGNSFVGKSEMAIALRDAAKEIAKDTDDVRLSGSPVFDEAFFRYSKRDFAVFTPVALLVVFTVVTFVFRRPTAVIVPLSVVVLAALWTHGLMGALGIKVNLVSTMLVALIVAIGVADSIHVLSEYYRQLALGKDRREAVEESMAHLLVPCFFTSATTVVALLSLLSSDLAPIGEFGWLAATGVALAFVLSMTFVPTILTVARPPDPAFIERQRSGPLNRLLVWIGSPTPKSSRRVLAGAVVVVAGFAAGFAYLEVGSNPINYFKKSDPIRQDFAVIDEALGGGGSAEFLVTAPEGGFLDPEKLRRIDEFQNWFGERPGIGQTLSILDGLRDLNKVMHDGDPAEAILPASRNLAAQYYLLMEGEEDFNAFLQDGYSVGRVSGRISFTRAGEVAKEMDRVNAKIAAEFSDPELTIEPTGYFKLMADMEADIVGSQIRSFLIAFSSILVMMMLLLKSVRLGLFSMIPNLAPIAMGIGFMGLTAIPLDPGTAMIASISLGLVVDDSVHFLHRLRTHLLAGDTLEAGILRSMTETGRPIVVTTIVLSAGYSILGLGSFAPNVYFGLVTAMVILFALVADLVVLPAALIVLRPRFAFAAGSISSTTPITSPSPPPVG